MSNKKRKNREERFKMKVRDVADALYLAISSGDLTIDEFEQIYKKVKLKTKND